MNFNPRIVVASMIGLLMVGGSYWFSSGREEVVDELPAIAIQQKPVRSFISVTDKDGDGQPDWQNTFNISTVDLDEISNEGPTTKTSVFVADLARLTGGSNINVPGALSDIGRQLSREALDKQYGREDILVAGDDSLFALRAYGNSVAAIALENAPPRGTESELTVLNRALLINDPSILEALAPTIASYENMVSDMLKTPAPSSLIKEHLSLINVYQALASDIRAFQGTFDDALPAMLRFRRYQADAEALYVAISALYLTLNRHGIEWTDADIASKFIKIE